MRNIKLIIEYDGTNYSGWQIQKRCKREDRGKKRTIQEVLEEVLAKILQDKVKVVASGRTDAGVHAKNQVANFKVESEISTRDLKKALNANLPSDIVIKKVNDVEFDFHARFNAKSKVYRYQISQKFLSCFDRLYFTYIPYILDLNLMRKEANVLIGRHNFKSFQSSGGKTKNTIRTIKDIKIKKRKRYIFIDIEADGFLYNMVRNIVGTLIEIGRGKFSPGSMRKILKAKDRKVAGPTVPAKGLFLMRVKY